MNLNKDGLLNYSSQHSLLEAAALVVFFQLFLSGDVELNSGPKQGGSFYV